MLNRWLGMALLALLVITAGVYYRFLQTGPDRVPDISLLSVDGKQLRLADFRGRPLLISFWSTTCTSCIRDMPHLAELYRELAPAGLEIIAIAMAHDPPNTVLEMRATRRIPYPVALDIHADAARAFGNVELTPTSFLIAPDGRVARRHTGSMDMTRLRREILAMIPARQDSSQGTAANLP